MTQVMDWRTIKDQFCDALLLGNGASRAVHTGFGYSSIYEEAKLRGHITSVVAQIFDQFAVNDFELVLRRLWQAKLVNNALNINSKEVDDAYKEVQNALIATIRDTHATYEAILTHLTPIYEFMQHFDTILTLNYDLVVYWATRESERTIGKWFKDCFINGEFTDDIDLLYEPYKANGATLFFYPHGNLVLARRDNDTEKKVVAKEYNNLLDTILNSWKNETVPIFVCEGTDIQKRLTIESSSYLQRVYREIIPNIGESLVVYGWSMAEQDQHILDQFKRAKIQRVAVSVHENNQTYISIAKDKLIKQGINEDNIVFFNAKSSGCWNNPQEISDKN